MTPTTHRFSVCSCGDAEPHIIARRSTYDGKHVLLWDDGGLTWALGYAIRGSSRPRTEAGVRLARIAGRLVLGDVCLYHADDVPDLIRAARWAAARGALPGDMRKRYSEITALKGPMPQWTVLSADRDGRSTVRVWRLPRLGGWEGLAVWHERGRYEIVREVQHGTGTYESTGFSAPTLGGVTDMLPMLRTKEVLQ